MSGQDLDRVHCIRQVVDGHLSQVAAAAQLRVTDRHVRRLVTRYRREGPQSLLHRLRGRPSNHQLPPGRKEQAVALVQEHYPDFGPTFASEQLAERHGLVIDRETLRLAMIEAGLWRPQQRRPHHRSWRERRAAVGELIQFDGSTHVWFEERGPITTLLLAIDDATGRLMDGQFSAETTVGVFRFWHDYCIAWGRPVALYLDRHSVYQTNRPIQGEGEPFDPTQFERAMDELDIPLIHALSPQAKGRIERSFGTHQDRLVKLLRLEGITTADAANQYLRDVYLPAHNRRFAVLPREAADAHRPLRPTDDLATIFAIQEERTVARDFTVRHRGTFYQLGPEQPVTIFPKDRVTVAIQLDGSVHLLHTGAELRWAVVTHPRPITARQWVLPGRTTTATIPWKPAANHPWRRMAFGRRT